MHSQRPSPYGGELDVSSHAVDYPVGRNFAGSGFHGFGLAWALVDGYDGGAIFAWLYNLLSGANRNQPVMRTDKG